MQLGKLAANIPEVPWEMEVNDHWKLLRETVSSQCAAWFPKEKRQQRQRYMSETAWGLVCQRKDLRIEIHRAQRDQQQRLLQYIFRMWRSGDRQSSLGDVDEHLVDQQIALNIWKRNQLQKSFKRLKLQERKEWAMKCAETFQGSLCQARVVDWYKMIKPKRAIKGKTIGTSQMPGIKAPDGQWVTSKRQVSVMWQAHFGAIEHARNAQGKDILAMSQPDGVEKTLDTLLATPTIFEMEKAMRQMDVRKAPGPDQLGAEVWKTNVPQMAKKVFPIFLKTSMRCQWVAEMAGGDLIPLHKKGDPTQAANHRAILLEPVIGRFFSKAWRSRVVNALEQVSALHQFGGNKGASIEVAHLLVRSFQQSAVAMKCSCSLLFADLKAAFYTVAKPFLTADGRDREQVVELFKIMKLPPDALADFVEAIEEGILVPQNQGHLQSIIGAMLKHTWAKAPGAPDFLLPQTGSRPGDPLADALFGFLMSKALKRIDDRCRAEDLIQDACSAVAWVDDAVFQLRGSAANIVEKTRSIARILHEEMTRIGMKLNYGTGKTEVVLTFAGKKAVQHSQEFYQQQGGKLIFCNEYEGCLAVRVVEHYKHLGGYITKNQSLHPELRTRGGQMAQQLKAIKRTVLANPELPIEKRRILLHALGTSVLTLHVGVWRPLQQCEWQKWHGLVRGLYQHLQGRLEDGTVPHKTIEELSFEAAGPMPLALLYLRRLRVFVQLVKALQTSMLQMILHNAEVAKDLAWVSGVQGAIAWLKMQVDDKIWIADLDALMDAEAWWRLHGRWHEVKRLVQKAQKMHLLRNQMCMDAMHHKQRHDALLKEAGWTFSGEEEHPVEQAVSCDQCGKTFQRNAALSVHQHKAHGLRVAARRVAVNGQCGACRRNYHTRPRLILLLQYGNTMCLTHLLRHGPVVSEDAANALDQQDVAKGVANHQKGVKDISASRVYFAGHEETMEVEDPTAEEIQNWKQVGALPKWMDGREKTVRQKKAVLPVDSIEQLAKLEEQWCAQAAQWVPPQSTVVRPLAEGRLFFLVFFSGHRRDGDLIQYLEWTDALITPIPIDLAIDGTWGNALDCNGQILSWPARFWDVIVAHLARPIRTQGGWK